jgi:hypothetical protein
MPKPRARSPSAGTLGHGRRGTELALRPECELPCPWRSASGTNSPPAPRLAGGTCGRRRHIRQGCGKSPSSDPPQSRWFPVWVSASRRRLKDAKASPDAPERATSWRERPSWLLRSDGATGTEAVVLAWLCSLWTGDSPDAAPGITQPANSDNRSGPVEFLQVRPTDPSASSRDDVSHGDWRGHDVVRLGRDRVRPGTPMSRRSGLRLAIVDAVPSRECRRCRPSPWPSVPWQPDSAVPESRFDSFCVVGPIALEAGRWNSPTSVVTRPLGRTSGSVWTGGECRTESLTACNGRRRFRRSRRVPGAGSIHVKRAFARRAHATGTALSARASGALNGILNFLSTGSQRVLTISDISGGSSGSTVGGRSQTWREKK